MYSNSIKIFLVVLGIIIGVNSETTILEQTNNKETEHPNKVLHLLESNVPFRFEIDYVVKGPPDNFYLTRLHIIDSDSLMIVDTLNYKPNKGIVGWVEWIKHYPNEKLIIVLERLEYSGYFRKSIVNYRQGIKVNHFYFRGGIEYAITDMPILMKSRSTRNLLYNFIFKIGENNTKHIYKDLEFNSLFDINFEEYFFIHEGRAGSALREPFGVSLPLVVSGDNCQVHIHYEWTSDPAYVFTFPCDREETTSTISFHLINDQYFIFHRSPKFEYFPPFNDTANVGAILNLYDYQNGLLDTFHVRGGMSTGLSYLKDDWIYGTVGFRRPSKLNRKHYQPDSYSPSPGDRVYDYNIFSMDSRYFDHGKYGIPFEWREYDQGLYLPGELYSLHLPTMKQTYWSTGQGDSEILLLNDEEVIYREHHKIFRAPIVDYKPMIEERELLVMDSLVVPHIHWAFYAEEGTINKTEINKDGFEEYMEER